MCDLPCGVLVSRFKRVILGIVLNCTPQISHVGFQNQIVLCSVLFCSVLAMAVQPTVTSPGK